MSLKPIRPAPLPPSKNSCANSVFQRKHDDNNNKHPKSFSTEIHHPTVIRPKQSCQQQGRKKKAPPPRPAPPKVTRPGVGKCNSHGNQKPSYASSLLADDLASIFGGYGSTKGDKIKPKSECQPNSRRTTTHIVRRSMKKRAPNPLGNSTKSNGALIDFDSPAFDAFSNNNLSQKPGGNIATAQEKSLLDMDDPFLTSNNQNDSLAKSNKLHIENTFQDFPSFTLNGTEKCGTYFTTTNSVPYPQAARNNEKLQKSAVAPQSYVECMGKENRIGSTAFQQPTIIYPAKSSKAKLTTSQSDGQINSSSFSHKQNMQSHATISSRSSQQKDYNIFYDNAEPVLSINWNNANNASYLNSTSTENDHCASPFSDISSLHTISSVDSSDELCLTGESLPEPEFPPPPPPPSTENTLENDTDSTNVDTTSQLCKALYDFEPESTEELGFKQGEYIYFEKKITDDWWQGYANGQRGMFPSSFVQVLDNPKSSETEQKSCTVKALYQFDGEVEGDLSFKADDEIRVLSRINKDWLFGECNGKKGQFPASFVHQKQSYNNKGLCIARYSFAAENSNELSIEEGDKIIITEYVNEDWWRGMLFNNHSKSGMFPCSFVEKTDGTI